MLSATTSPTRNVSDRSRLMFLMDRAKIAREKRQHAFHALQLAERALQDANNALQSVCSGLEPTRLGDRIIVGKARELLDLSWEAACLQLEHQAVLLSPSLEVNTSYRAHTEDVESKSGYESNLRSSILPPSHPLPLVSMIAEPMDKREALGAPVFHSEYDSVTSPASASSDTIARDVETPSAAVDLQPKLWIPQTPRPLNHGLIVHTNCSTNSHSLESPILGALERKNLKRSRNTDDDSSSTEVELELSSRPMKFQKLVAFSNSIATPPLSSLIPTPTSIAIQKRVPTPFRVLAPRRRSPRLNKTTLYIRIPARPSP